ncbi:MAG: PQQ-dependent sugar dehydrogenase [Cyanobacteria bacterium P01_D01_bin.1]
MVNFNLDGFVNEGVITSGLAAPISLGFLPDNRMLLLEKGGQVLIADPNSGANSLYLDISNIVNSGQERGLLEMAIPSDFEPEPTNGKNLIYLFYTRSANTKRAVIASFEHEEGSGGLSSTANINTEQILWTDTDGYVSCCHYGGGLDFGPDGKLWLTSSDKFNTSNGGEGGPDDDWTANLENTSGKIIRINRNGSIPDGTDGWPANPYADGVIDGPYPSVNPQGQPFQPHPSIWAYGLRNPFRADWDEEYGKFYIGEVGGNRNQSTDDIHVASLDQPGVFYGWNFYEGKDSAAVFNPKKAQFDPADFPQPSAGPANPSKGDYFSAPIYDMPHSSLTGGFVYRGDLFPSEFNGVYFFGNYEDSYIRFLDLNETGDTVKGLYDFKPSGDIPGNTTNVVFLEEGNDGALYYINYAANGGQVQRITYGGNSAPSIVSSSITDDQGNPSDQMGTAVPLNVTYAATVEDGNTPLNGLTYQINFGDGTVVNGAPDPTTGAIAHDHQYTTEGVYNAVLSVSDGDKSTLAEPLAITVGTVNSAPQFQSAAVNVAFIDPGDPVTFSATVTDADDPVESLTYTLNFGDGSAQVTGSPDSDGKIEAAHTYTDAGSYNASFTISDGKAEPVVSDTIEIQVGISSQLPVTDGLVFQVEAFTKIGLDGTNVTKWIDQSSFGNNLRAVGNPQLIETATPSGQPAVALNGNGDYLFRENTPDTPLQGLSSGNEPRTMFFVVDYEDVTNSEYAGLVYGKASQNRVFGLTLEGNEDDLTVHGWGGKHDQPTDVDGVVDPNSGQQRGFISHAVTFDGTTYKHYLNGVEIDSGTKKYKTVVDKLLIGQNMNGGQTPMSVAAAMIYSRALNSNEFGAVENYIRQTYLVAS